MNNSDKIGLAVWISIVTIVVLIIMGVICGNASSNDAIEHDSRIEVIEQGHIDGTYTNYYIVVDRNTDVEYLIIGKNDNYSITTMRDTGGTVLRRE